MDEAQRFESDVKRWDVFYIARPDRVDETVLGKNLDLSYMRRDDINFKGLEITDDATKVSKSKFKLIKVYYPAVPTTAESVMFRVNDYLDVNMTHGMHVLCNVKKLNYVNTEIDAEGNKTCVYVPGQFYHQYLKEFQKDKIVFSKDDFERSFKDIMEQEGYRMNTINQFCNRLLEVLKQPAFSKVCNFLKDPFWTDKIPESVKNAPARGGVEDHFDEK